MIMENYEHKACCFTVGRKAWRVMVAAMVLTAAAPLSYASASSGAWTDKVPAAVMRKLELGAAQSLIVLFDDQAIEHEARAMRTQRHTKTDTAPVQSMKAARYVTLKQAALAVMPAGQHAMLRDYSHLPMVFVRFDTPLALRTLLQRPDVVAVYPDEKKQAILTESLPLIGQTTVAAGGDQGTGSTVLAIDTGVDYTKPAFGSCTAPGVPASCHVSYYQNNADSSAVLDSFGHGSTVSAIALAVAPGSKVAMINVFGAIPFALDSNILAAINFGIANQAAMNIVAMNMSLGSSSNNVTPCSNPLTNPYVTPIANAKAAGIVVAIASGNDGLSTGLASPACTPNAVSVGAVYDANMSARSFGTTCSDASTAADKVACYSNSASYLTLLAPGSVITTSVNPAGGDGTSFAAPFVAGAAAVLHAAFPSETPDQTILRMTSSGKPVTDTRNGVTTPRLNLLAAARPANDAFVNRIALLGAAGGVIGYNAVASKESGEPNHANNLGGASVWWKWVAPASGQLALNTHGSSFDTLLGVYTGGTVNALTTIAANDNDGMIGGVSSVLFQARTGVEYEIAVDGFNGAAGNIALNWSLNSGAAADLSLSATGTGSVNVGTPVTINYKVSNAGPQSATNSVLVVTLPSSLTYASASAPCSASAAIVTCRVGSVAAATIATLTINTTAVVAGAYSVSGSVSSDTPDPVTANNSYGFSSVVNPVGTSAGGGDTDAPTLPEWGTMLMALLLVTIGLRRSLR